MRTLKTLVPILVFLIINYASALDQVTDDAVIVEGAITVKDFNACM